MKLTVKTREGNKKGVLRAIRREGDIPAILYGAKEKTCSLRVNGSEFQAHLRSLEKGHLPTTVFELHVGKEKVSAIVKEIQYHPTTYQVIHLDFQEMQKGGIIEVNIPVECTHKAECVGVKLGGFLRQVKGHVKVRCAFENLPTSFSVDVQKLGIKQSKRVRDLEMPRGVECLASKEDVVVTVGK